MTNIYTQMPFFKHLEELRTRLVRMLIGIGVGFGICVTWAENIFGFLTRPLKAGFPSAQLIGTGPADAFVTQLQVAFAAGILLSAPFTFYQLWRFVAPALHENERRFALPFVFFTTLFFVFGVAFSFFVAFPFAFQYFATTYEALATQPDLRLNEYLEFIVTLMFVFGIVFELPVLGYFLARFGLVTHRWYVKHIRIAIVAIFVIAGIFTPPDVISQLLLAGPLLVLYGLCILIAYLVEKQKKSA